MTVSLPGNRGNLYAAVLIVNIGSFAIGTHYTWSSPSIPKLEKGDSWITIDEDQASWLGSLTSLGSVIGPFLGGWLVNLLGRRRAVIAAVIIGVIAWVEVLLSRNVWEIYVGRVLGGIGGGITFVACPLYVAEISEVAVRGALGPIFALALVGGYVLEYCVGPYVSYTVLIIVNLIPSVVFFLLIPFTPESPYYYLKKGDDKSALECLLWLRSGRTVDQVQKEVDGIKEAIARSVQNQPRFIDMFTIRRNWMGLIIVLGIFTAQQLVGTNVVLFYTQEIFDDAHTSISSSGSTIVVGLVLVIFRILATPLVRAFGMRWMLIYSAIGCSVFQSILAIYSYYDESIYDISEYNWVPIATMIAYTLCMTVGFGPLPWAVMAEVFSPEVKAKATSFCAAYNWLFCFLLTKYFTQIGHLYGMYVPYCVFAVSGVLSLIFTIYMLPDTRGMTLEEVTDLLDGKPSRLNEKK